MGMKDEALDKETRTETEKAAPEPNAKSEFVPFKALHHLPRGKNAWNPAILKKWWFWPASVLGLILLNVLCSFIRTLLGE